MANVLEIHALLVTLDPWLLSVFTDVSHELGIETQKSGDVAGIPDQIRRAKYEALVIDFDTIPEALQILASVQDSRSNQDALVFAVATGSAQKQQALNRGANIVFERPFASADIRRALSSAYDRMARGRRRYFRFAAEMPVVLTPQSTGIGIRCSTINISSSGMAVATLSPFAPGETVDIALSFFDPGLTARVIGTVVWDDRHGKAGICFRTGMLTEIDDWLDRRFYGLLQERRLIQQPRKR
jgi:hypothetical protein